MRIVFMGTPQFAASILENLYQHHEIAAVFTRPDAVRGRGKNMEASPVKHLALKLGIPVYEPLSLSSEKSISLLQSLAPDVICVAAYGALLPQKILDIPVYTCLNVHASLLPKWRGAAPIERSILAGDTETGVCIMQMEEGLDTGPYCICRVADMENKTANELSDELSNLGANALLTALVHLESGVVEWVEQEDDKASYAHKIEKHELFLKEMDSARTIVLKVRASSDAHPARCIIAGKTVTVLKVQEVSSKYVYETLGLSFERGSLAYASKKLFLGTSDGVVEVLELKPDGKKGMSAQAFCAGIQGIKSHSFTWEEL